MKTFVLIIVVPPQFKENAMEGLIERTHLILAAYLQSALAGQWELEGEALTKTQGIPVVVEDFEERFLLEINCSKKIMKAAQLVDMTRATKDSRDVPKSLTLRLEGLRNKKPMHLFITSRIGSDGKSTLTYLLKDFPKT